MHIPDGYIGPQTWGPGYGVMAVVWAAVSARLNKTLKDRQIPLLALCAAFSFVIMMFNIPIPLPGKTTAHAVGAVLIAILLGPSAACVAVTVALVIQAFFFGDGGITAIGANCFNMAFVMPFVGFGVYKLLGGTRMGTSAFRPIAAGIAAYVGLNAAALLLAIQLGIQPLIAHDAAGKALYAPYGLKVALAAVMAEHLLIAGVVEALVTGLVVSYLQKAEPALLGLKQSVAASKGATGQ